MFIVVRTAPPVPPSPSPLVRTYLQIQVVSNVYSGENCSPSPPFSLPHSENLPPNTGSVLNVYSGENCSPSPPSPSPSPPFSLPHSENLPPNYRLFQMCIVVRTAPPVPPSPSPIARTYLQIQVVFSKCLYMYCQINF